MSDYHLKLPKTNKELASDLDFIVASLSTLGMKKAALIIKQASIRLKSLPDRRKDSKKRKKAKKSADIAI